MVAPEALKPGGNRAKVVMSRGPATKKLYRKRPPYAHAIISSRQRGIAWNGSSPDGRNHTAWVLIGSNAWELAKRWQARNRLVTLMPPDEQPSNLDWSCLSGLGTVLLHRCGDCNGTAVVELIRELLSIGVKVLEHPSLVLHERAGQ